MSLAFAGRWARLTAPYADVLGPLQPTEPILFGRAAKVGRYAGEPVWLSLSADSDGDFSLDLAVSLGDQPIQGALCTPEAADESHAGLTGDAAFDRAYSATGLPREVAALALDAPTRTAVHRCFRSGRVRGSAVTFRSGFVTVSGEFREPSSIGIGVGPLRPPSHQEVAVLVADLVLIGRRFRWAYQQVLTEIARTQGDAAAAAWDGQLRAEREASDRRSRTIRTVTAVVALGCVAFMFAITIAALVVGNALWG